MPADQRGSVYKTGRGYGIRWYHETGVRRRRAGFSSRSDARRWFQDVERPRMRGDTASGPLVSFSRHVERYLEAHAVAREASTISTLRHRLSYAEAVRRRSRTLAHISRALRLFAAVPKLATTSRRLLTPIFAKTDLR